MKGRKHKNEEYSSNGSGGSDDGGMRGEGKLAHAARIRGREGTRGRWEVGETGGLVNGILLGHPFTRGGLDGSWKTSSGARARAPRSMDGIRARAQCRSY